MSDWKQLADAAHVEIGAALTTLGGESDAILHLRDAQENLVKAIEALDEALEEQE